MDGEISLKQHRALVVLLTGGSLQEAAEVAEVSVASVKKWRQKPNFSRVLKESIVKVYDAALAKLCLAMAESADELIRIIRDPDCSDRVKINAINILFDNAKLAKDFALNDRLTALEDALNGEPSEHPEA